MEQLIIEKWPGRQRLVTSFFIHISFGFNSPSLVVRMLFSSLYRQDIFHVGVFLSAIKKKKEKVRVSFWYLLFLKCL
jgi:hypothetical protein